MKTAKAIAMATFKEKQPYELTVANLIELIRDAREDMRKECFGQIADIRALFHDAPKDASLGVLAAHLLPRSICDDISAAIKRIENK